MAQDAGRQILLEVDSRRRISLGSLARHDRYLVEVSEDGVIVLTPAIVMPVTEATARVDDFLDHPEGGTRRTRTMRGGGRHIDGLRDPNREQAEKEEKET